MDLTTSYEQSIPAEVRTRYELRETRNAAAILAATNLDEFQEIIEVITGFKLLTSDLVDPGGNRGRVAQWLDEEFRQRGWREGEADTSFRADVRAMPYRAGGETQATVVTTEVSSKGYKVDNVKGRVVLDVEWNAKDGNLDRDIGVYRALYDAGVIDGAVMITRTLNDLRQLAGRLALEAGQSPEAARNRLSTTTTTNLTKLEPKLTRGDAGGCPLLAIAISARCWTGA
ncbi:MAG TPA: BglII/BstYI family type II restriction endonuclease [Streptosporangiaceae bacterium]